MQLAEVLHEAHVGCGIICEQADDPALSPTFREASAQSAIRYHGPDATALAVRGYVLQPAPSGFTCSLCRWGDDSVQTLTALQDHVHAHPEVPR